jgi:hypothetical protein
MSPILVCRRAAGFASARLRTPAVMLFNASGGLSLSRQTASFRTMRHALLMTSLFMTFVCSSATAGFRQVE